MMNPRKLPPEALLPRSNHAKPGLAPGFLFAPPPDFGWQRQAVRAPHNGATPAGTHDRFAALRS